MEEEKMRSKIFEERDEILELQRIIKQTFDDQNNNEDVSGCYRELIAILERLNNEEEKENEEEEIKKIEKTINLAETVFMYVNKFDDDLQTYAVNTLVELFTNHTHLMVKEGLLGMLREICDMGVNSDSRMNVIDCVIKQIIKMNLYLSSNNNEEEEEENSSSLNNINNCQHLHSILAEVFCCIAANHPSDVISVLLCSASPSNFAQIQNIIADIWLPMERGMDRSPEDAMHCYRAAYNACEGLSESPLKESEALKSSMMSLMELWEKPAEYGRGRGGGGGGGGGREGGAGGKKPQEYENEVTEEYREDEGEEEEEEEEEGNSNNSNNNNNSNGKNINNHSVGENYNDEDTRNDAASSTLSKNEEQKETQNREDEEEGDGDEEKHITNEEGGGGEEGEEKDIHNSKNNEGRVGDGDSNTSNTNENDNMSEEGDLPSEDLLSQLNTAEEEGEIEEDDSTFERVADTNEKSRSIEILNAPSNIDHKQLKIVLEKFGEVVNTRCTYTCNAPIIVTYASEKSAEKAKNYLDEKKIGTKHIQVIYSNNVNNNSVHTHVDGKQYRNNRLPSMHPPPASSLCSSNAIDEYVPPPPPPPPHIPPPYALSPAQTHAHSVHAHTYHPHPLPHGKVYPPHPHPPQLHATRPSANPNLQPGTPGYGSAVPSPPSDLVPSPPLSSPAGSSSSSSNMLPPPSSLAIPSSSSSAYLSNQYKNKVILRPNPYKSKVPQGMDGGGENDEPLNNNSLNMNACILTEKDRGGGGGRIVSMVGDNLMLDSNEGLCDNNNNEYMKNNNSNVINSRSGIRRERITLDQRMHSAVSTWTENDTFEEQMEDYRRLYKLFGFTNRYILLSNIPCDMYDEKAIEDWVRKLSKQEVIETEFIHPHKSKKKQTNEGMKNNKDDTTRDNCEKNKEKEKEENGTVCDKEGEKEEEEEEKVKDDKLEGNHDDSEPLKKQEKNKKETQEKVEEEKEKEEEEIQKDEEKCQDEEKNKTKTANNDNKKEEKKNVNEGKDDKSNVEEDSVRTDVLVHITFRTQREASEAYKYLVANNDGIVVEHAGPRKPNSCLWLGNIKPFMCKDGPMSALRAMFARFGEIIRFKMMAEKNCGFVSFKTKQIATKARNHLFAVPFSYDICLNIDFAPCDDSAYLPDAMQQQQQQHNMIAPPSYSSSSSSSFNSQFPPKKKYSYYSKPGGLRDARYRRTSPNLRYSHTSFYVHPSGGSGDSYNNDNAPYPPRGGPPPHYAYPPSGGGGVHHHHMPPPPPKKFDEQNVHNMNVGNAHYYGSSSSNLPPPNSHMSSSSFGYDDYNIGGKDVCSHTDLSRISDTHTDAEVAALLNSRRDSGGGGGANLSPSRGGSEHSGGGGGGGAGLLSRHSLLLDLLKSEAHKDPSLLDKLIVDLAKRKLLTDLDKGGESPRRSRRSPSSSPRSGGGGRGGRGRSRSDSGGGYRRSRSNDGERRGRKRPRDYSKESRGGGGRGGVCDNRNDGRSKERKRGSGIEGVGRRRGGGMDDNRQYHHHNSSLSRGDRDGGSGGGGRRSSHSMDRYPGGNKGGGGGARRGEYLPRGGGAVGGFDRTNVYSRDKKPEWTGRKYRNDNEGFYGNKSYHRKRGRPGSSPSPPPGRALSSGGVSGPHNVPPYNDSNNAYHNNGNEWGGGGEGKQMERKYRSDAGGGGGNMSMHGGNTDSKLLSGKRVMTNEDKKFMRIGEEGGGQYEDGSNDDENHSNSPCCPLPPSCIPPDEDVFVVCKVLKQGTPLCQMSAKYVGGDVNVRPRSVLDVNQRANVDRLLSHRKKCRHSLWQLGADTANDSKAYDSLCDYFILKDRVGLLETDRQTVYMIPPNPKYKRKLSLPDSNFMYAYVISRT